MGSRLVSGAYAFVREHNERARNAGERELTTLELALLTLMAHTAVDEHAEPVFWVKRSEICAQLGIRDTEAGRKRIQRALSALAASGAIALPGRYLRGQTPRYRLIYQGGYSASTPDAEVWTPGIHPTRLKGDAQRPKYGRQASRSMDARHPLEEGRGTKEEGDARATALELTATTSSTATNPPPWDLHLPQPTTAQEAARCPEHPTGTTERCWTCGENRRTWLAARHITTGRKPKAPRYDCTAGRHRVVGEKAPGIPDDHCVNCDAHPVVDAHAPAPVGAIA